MISVIIPFYNSKEYLKDCLSSLFDSSYKDFEILVVDDNSSDSPGEIVKGNNLVKLITNNRNLGPSISRNKAAKIAQGELLFFLDVDTKVEPDALTNAVKAFKENNKMGAAQAQLILGNTDKLDSAGHYLSPIGFPYEIGNNQPVLKFGKKLKILGGKSAGLVIRKRVFDQINGFDEDYFIYGEDTDLCWRVWLTGHQVFYLPSVKVRHFLKSSLNQSTNYRIYYEGSKNNLSNLLKNLSFVKLIWMYPIHFLCWLLLSIKLFLQRKFKLCIWLYRGLLWNILHLPKIFKKRQSIKNHRLDNDILFGEINLQFLVKKSMRWLKHV